MTLHDERDRRFAQAEAALAEYFARVEAGEAIDFDEWSAQHAEIAGELEQLHALCQPLRRSGATPREDPAASAAHEAAARLALESLRRRPNRYADYEIDAHPLASGGMATISGGVMAVYISLGADPVAILTTSVMAAPCGLYLSKILMPELEVPETRGRVSGVRRLPGGA